MPDRNIRLARRRALRLLGAIGTGFFATRTLRGELAAAATPTVAGTSCVLTPTLTEGPFFVDNRLNRSDLTAGTRNPGVVSGLPLQLVLRLNSVRDAGCSPVAGMQVDVWHASANGEYSDVGMGQGSTRGESWLRGYQTSDADGKVAFKTIYPGGRAVHIHLKARMFNAAGNTTYEFTTQLFFDDAVNDLVMARAPYNARGRRNTRNAQDFLYGDKTNLLADLAPTPDSSQGYVATAALGLALRAGA